VFISIFIFTLDDQRNSQTGQQISVQLSTSADDVALPAFVERRALAPLLSRAIDRYLLSAGPTAANPPAAAACGGCMLDRRTDVTQPSLILYSTV